MKQSLSDWVSEHRDEIREAIAKRCPNCRLNGDDDLEEWVINDEGLYMWAKGEGVNVDDEDEEDDEENDEEDEDLEDDDYV